MIILLWVLQVLLALAFFAHGWLMLFPPAAMVDQINASIPRWFQLFLGVAEVMAAVGLTLPGLTRIQPWLVPCAAAGTMIVMICATVYHLSRGEVSWPPPLSCCWQCRRSSPICAGASLRFGLDASRRADSRPAGLRRPARSADDAEHCPCGPRSAIPPFSPASASSGAWTTRRPGPWPRAAPSRARARVTP